MKKILIIEDNREIALKMKEILDKLGEVRVCTKPDLVEVNFDFEKMEMPSKAFVLEEIKWAEIILLDNNLGANYKGKDLLRFCEGKRVIGISNGPDLGEINFSNKSNLDLEHIQVLLLKKASAS